MPKKIPARKAPRHLPYARGFQPPTSQQQKLAIGCAPSIPDHLRPDKSFFAPLPKPTSEDDWLAQYNEDGQTFTQFLRDCPWLSVRKMKYMKTPFQSNGSSLLEKYPKGKIYLVKLGDFSLSESAPPIDDLVSYAGAFFHLPIHVLPWLKLDINGGVVYLMDDKDDGKADEDTRKGFRPRRRRLNARCDSDTRHLQLDVGTVLAHLRTVMPDDAICLVAVTMHDLFSEQSDLFVAGMAAGNQRVGVFSFYRYQPTLNFSVEYWYEVDSDERFDLADAKKLVLHRSCKLLVHEICHILGIDHCIFFSCCMNGSGHLEEDYRQSMHLCPVDLHKLQVLCGFDVVERYRSLLSFFREHSMIEEEQWVTRRLSVIGAKILL